MYNIECKRRNELRLNAFFANDRRSFRNGIIIELNVIIRENNQLRTQTVPL